MSKIFKYNLNIYTAHNIKFFLWFLLAFAGRHLTLWNYFLGEEGTASYIVVGNRLDASQKKKIPRQRNYCADVGTTVPSPHWLFGSTWIYSFNTP